MNRKFLKVVSVVLSVIMLMSLAIPVVMAYDTQWISSSRSDVPIIRISGDGEQLVDENGNKVFHYKDIGSIFEGDEEEGEEDDNNEIYEAIANVMLPFIMEGLVNDNWEPYYENLQAEIGDLFEESLLDENGNPQYGTGIRPFRKEYLADRRSNDKAWWDGPAKYYAHDQYWFYYDWRIDPLESADELNSYINDILEATGCSEVGIVASCLGTNVVTSYVAKYGVNKIRGIAFDGSVVKGAEMLSEVISGKFAIDPAAISRALDDCRAIGLFDIDEFVGTTLDMLARTGVFEIVFNKSKEWLYYKLVEGVTSALALSTFYTWPNYWACVSTDDFPTAMKYVFGEEGSEKRVKYAGLIAKLENYDKVVRQNADEIISSITEDGANFGVISKYGFQNLPICETNYLISDQFSSVRRSSFGATTSTIYDTLSEEYIASRGEKSKYISPDKQIDASTCIYPDSTWFIKGSSHSNWTDWELRLLYDIASSKDMLTVESSCWPSQFVVYEYPADESVDEGTGEIYAMTEENCDTENWEADEKIDKPADKYGKIFVAVTSFITWLIELFYKIIGKK